MASNDWRDTEHDAVLAYLFGCVRNQEANYHRHREVRRRYGRSLVRRIVPAGGAEEALAYGFVDEVLGR